MRSLLVIVILTLAGNSLLAQKDTSAVLDAVVKFEKAMVDKDSAALILLLHKDLVYAHSSAWVQKKKDVLADFKSGAIVYDKINRSTVLIDVNKESAIVQERVAASGTHDGKAFDVNLFVVQVWMHNSKGWQLYARHATKL